MEKIVRYLALAESVFHIADSGASAETKYELIFSDDLGLALAKIFSLDYYNPDTSYEEDIAAYVTALRAKCDELRKITGDTR
jgi:hypothetical protein